VVASWDRSSRGPEVVTFFGERFRSTEKLSGELLDCTRVECRCGVTEKFSQARWVFQVVSYLILTYPAFVVSLALEMVLGK
jgi:hypothetical protein